MKKKLAMLLAGVMALSMVPMTAFAKSTNEITNVAVVTTSTTLDETEAPKLIIKGDHLKTTSDADFTLTLKNAEWDADVMTEAELEAAIGYSADVKYITGSKAAIKVTGDLTSGIVIPLAVDYTAKGDATVTVDPRQSVLSAGEYKFATVTSSDVAVTSLGVANVAEAVVDGAATKAILFEEVVAKSFSGELKLRLTKNWSFTDLGTVTVFPEGAATVAIATGSAVGGRDLALTVTRNAGVSEEIIVKIAPKVQWNDEKVEAGDICEMIITGAGVDKTTLEVAKAITYGFSWTAEDDELEEIYWGQTGDVLDVTFAETIADSWESEKKTQIEFNEEVRVNTVTVEINEDTCGLALDGTYCFAGDDCTGTEHTGHIAPAGVFSINSDKNVLTFGADWKNPTGKVDVDFTFNVDVEAGYTGDITATLKGKGVDNEELVAVLGTAIAPVEVKVEKSDVVIDYRHTAVGDIIITEAEAGLLTDGATLAFQLEKLSFDDEPEVEVLAGDIELYDAEVKNGVIFVKVKNESVKEAGSFKITGATLYMERNIPAGDFYLKLVDTDTLTLPTGWTTDDVLFVNNFTQKLTVAKDYVSVVTAGRDVDETFTTTLVVTAGATEMKANDKVIALDVPAYITNDGRMMLPVRAVIEALSGAAIVAWDDTAKQITISTGSRVVAMKVGSDVMSINGVEVPMVKACEIVDSRAFVPVRDLGYALGLNDASIAYDAATSTATLN